MQVTKATFSSGCQECWITVKSISGELLIIHVIGDSAMEWNLGGNTLNVKPKR
jgi:hypothetical protein